MQTLTEDRAQRNANESPLLRLPPEIRNRIWIFAMKVDRVQVWSTRCRLHGLNILSARKGGAIALDAHGEPILKHKDNFGPICCPLRDLSAFHLPEVCRQVYAETSTLAFSVNTFLLGRRAFSQKYNWNKTLMLAQRDAITKVEFGHRDLYISLYSPHPISLRSRGFRNLKDCYIPLQTLKNFTQNWVDRDWVAYISRRLKEVEGDDLVVTFEKEAIKDEPSE